MPSQPQPKPVEASSSGQTTAETPHVAIPDMKEETGAIEEPDKQAPVLPEEKATLSEILSVLKNLLTSNADQSDKLHTAVEALKQKPEALDIKTAFWNAYKPLADEFDKEFKDKYGTNLDTSLIFAGLFSAVSSAFIIQIQPQLQPDPNVITQGLLLHLVQNITGSVPPGIRVPMPASTGVDSMVVIAQSFLYFSLFSTLLAALLAVLAKQWLLHYDSAGERGSMEHRGLERQRKVDGLQRWKFDFVMQIFPLLLQTSLLLFAAALSIYLWTVNNPSQNMKDKIMPRLSNALITAAREIADNPNMAQEMKATMSCAADIMLKLASTISGELTHGWDQQQEASSEEDELRYWENLRAGFDPQLSALEELVEKIGEEHGPKTTVEPAMPVE
ncbi:hypothetical protein GGX14DRAFT_600946 [Mycena pura]|uniref:DUF6535 domain-containing protein n=1 Tax=Mycena pura TaxID=153505 RepID=A0AAD6XX92_9AGAR|nr:hypothetical protein GGX14DRAFT_600946 [Mycena pura]